MIQILKKTLPAGLEPAPCGRGMAPKRRQGRGPTKAKAPSKPRQVLNLGSKGERVVERAKIGRLRDALIQPATMIKYQNALAYFFRFLDTGGLELPSCQDDLDDVVCECIEYMWETGEPRSLCGNLLSSIPFHSHALYGRLKGAWKLHQLWGQKEIPVRAAPLSKIAAFAIAHQFYRWGYLSDSVVLVLAFFRFLRTGEFLSLRAGQFAFDKHLQRAHITFPQTKSSQLKGVYESVHVDDPGLVKALHHITRYLQPGDLLMSMERHVFQSYFRQAIATLGLRSDIKPYSFRRGGATWHFQQHASFDATAEIGRWSSVKTCRIYVHTALLELSTMAEPQSDLLHMEAKRLSRALHSLR